MPRKTVSELAQARRFALVLAALCALLAVLALRRGRPELAAAWAGAAAAAPLAAWAFPPAWLRLFRGWMLLAGVLSWLSTRVVLGAFFYLILTPAGVVSRRLRRDPLDLAFRDGRTTYWIDKEPEELTVDRYRKQY